MSKRHRLCSKDSRLSLKTRTSYKFIISFCFLNKLHGTPLHSFQLCDVNFKVFMLHVYDGRNRLPRKQARVFFEITTAIISYIPANKSKIEM